MKLKQQLQIQLEDETVKIMLERTDLTYPQISEMLGVSESFIVKLAHRRRIQREPGRKKKIVVV